MSNRQPPSRLGTLAKQHSVGVEQEISKIQNIDAKVQQDIRSLRERLKMANSDECSRCKNYQRELKLKAEEHERQEKELSETVRVLTERLSIRNPAAKALSTSFSPLKDSQLSELKTERSHQTRFNYEQLLTMEKIKE